MRRVFHPETNGVKASRTGINGCSAMARPLTHLTHGIPTRRPFHPAKTASACGPGQRQNSSGP